MTETDKDAIDRLSLANLKARAILNVLLQANSAKLATHHAELVLLLEIVSETLAKAYHESFDADI